MYPPQYVYVLNVPNGKPRILSKRSDALRLAAQWGLDESNIVEARFVV